MQRKIQRGDGYEKAGRGNGSYRLPEDKVSFSIQGQVRNATAHNLVTRQGRTARGDIAM